MPSTADLSDLNSPLNRNGGNNTTRYNWQLNADNRGSDWYFESIADSSATAGERGDTFIANSAGRRRAADADDPDDRLGREARRRTAASWRASRSPSTARRPASDWQWFPDAGNGIRTNGQNVTGNDPNDANVPSTRRFQQGWVQHLVGTLGHGRQRRPALLHPRQRAEHLALDAPRRPPDRRRRWTRSKQRMVDYADEDQGASIPARWSSGPEEWGWSGYFYSGYDQQYGSPHGWSTLPDRNSARRRGLPALAARRSSDRTTPPTGKRLLDVFTVHYYPQGGEFGDDISHARCSCGATARRARCGIRTTSTRPGSTTRCS